MYVNIFTFVNIGQYLYTGNFYGSKAATLMLDAVAHLASTCSGGVKKVFGT